MSEEQASNQAAAKGGCLTITVIFFLIPMLLFFSCQGVEREVPPHGLERTVYRLCHEALEKFLKDPDSAQYSDETAKMTPTVGGATWQASGTVRARNSFGGMVVASYSCQCTYKKDGEAYSAQAWLIE